MMASVLPTGAAETLLQCPQRILELIHAPRAGCACTYSNTLPTALRRVFPYPDLCDVQTEDSVSHGFQDFDSYATRLALSSAVECASIEIFEFRYQQLILQTGFLFGLRVHTLAFLFRECLGASSRLCTRVRLLHLFANMVANAPKQDRSGLLQLDFRHAHTLHTA